MPIKSTRIRLPVAVRIQKRKPNCSNFLASTLDNLLAFALWRRASREEVVAAGCVGQQPRKADSMKKRRRGALAVGAAVVVLLAVHAGRLAFVRPASWPAS